MEGLISCIDLDRFELGNVSLKINNQIIRKNKTESFVNQNEFEACILFSIVKKGSQAQSSSESSETSDATSYE